MTRGRSHWRHLAVVVGVFISTFISLPASAQTPPSEPLSNQVTDGMDPQDVLTMLDEPGRTQLPITGRRFRIDYQVEQITLVFFREPGSSPVILIQPDGSKWYAARHPPENVTWHSQAEFDMITIDRPTPGPWQVAGRVLPDSSAMVVTEVTFHPEPLPSPLYRGELLKVEGTLTNGGKPIETPSFRDVISLEVIFISSNNPKYDNFGVDPVRAGEFRDDGRDLDEAPGDGRFTGSFRLNVRAGEYRPTYRVATPLLQRSLQQEPVVVENYPVTVEVRQAVYAEDDHQLLFSVNAEQLQLDTVIINGSTLFPNADIQSWTLDTSGEPPYVLSFPNYAYGRYVTTIDFFGTDIHGREIRGSLVPVEFVANEPPPPPPTEAELAEQKRQLEAAQAAEAQRLQEEEEAAALFRLVLIVVINLAVVGLAIGVFWWLKRRQRKSQQQAVSTHDDE